MNARHIASTIAVTDSDAPWGTSVASVPMIHAVVPSTFLLLGIKNVTIIQNDPTIINLVVDSVSYYLYK